MGHFVFIQLSGLAWGHVEDQGAKANPPDLFDEMAHLFEHLANLPVLALGQHNFVPGIIRIADQADPGWLGHDPSLPLPAPASLDHHPVAH